jgi:undecaprenyl phosphate N,N'-diacetylbacillosamine 1-phosphate transferase
MYKHYFKRIFDIIGALILLPLLLLVIIILSPIIFYTDKGNIFYNASRAGYMAKAFKMFKFRSMYANSLDIRNEDGSTYNADDDPRVTPVGKFIRKYSLDELPQLLNVLIGDMSFVGPRPNLPENHELEGLTGDAKDRYLVKPGITGYVQAYYRNSISQDEKYKWDSYYAEHVSMWLDIKILYMTFWSVVNHKNINTYTKS